MSTVLSKPTPEQPCPCGTGKLFADCCGPVISRQRPAANGQELMRSRFTAHVVEDYEYLHRTYLPTAHKPYVAEDGDPTIGWTKLEVHAHEPGSSPDQEFVEFSAFYVDENKNEHVMQERSEFRRVEGTWFFARPVRSGPAPKKSAGPKVGRNDPCPCGSGKKYKHCCL